MGRFAEIADHFRRRSIALGQEGYFGTLFTHHLRLRGVYSALASLIDNPNLSFLLEGARGTGKARTVQEFVRLENIYRKLLTMESARFCKVSGEARLDVLNSLSEQDNETSTSLFYFGSLETFSMHEQELTCRILRRQDTREQPYRLVFGCEESLVFMVQKGKILSELVEHLRPRSFAMPRLRERFEDFPGLMLEFSQRYQGRRELPTHGVLEKLMAMDYPYNLDSLSGVVKKALTLDPHPSQWTSGFVEKIHPLARVERTEKILDFPRGLRYQ